MGWWGMTETVTQGIVAEPYQHNRPGSMGHPSPFYDIEVRREDGKPAAAGETGQLFIRGVPGVSLFLEYLEDPDATAAAFDPGGWFITGDVVRLEDDGSLTFSDRAKDMIKVGGENVAASEVEVVIRGLPHVQDVAVVGQPHLLLDEVPVAFVIAAGGRDPELLRQSIFTSCASELARFKVPWDVIFVDELPRSLLEKVAKAELRRCLPQLSGDTRAESMRHSTPR
jgi:crotonobetaine/carnitine-CoA ligase